MCCTCKSGGEEGDSCECCGGDLVAKSRTPEGRVKVAFFCLNVDLLVISCIGFVTSLSGVGRLDVIGDAGALSFARWAPLSICIIGIVFGSITCRLPITVRDSVSKVVYMAVIALVFSFLLISGIILLTFEKSVGQAANQDSRYISQGVGSHLRIVANDRAMAVWNMCCVSYLETGYNPVRSCSDQNACEDQTELCACYQNEAIYRSMFPSIQHCATLQDLKVATVYNDTFILAPLVGTTQGSCGGGNAKRFQQSAVIPVQDEIRPLGVAYIVYSCVMFVWAAICSLDVLYWGNGSELKREKQEPALTESGQKPSDNGVADDKYRKETFAEGARDNGNASPQETAERIQEKSHGVDQEHRTMMQA